MGEIGDRKLDEKKVAFITCVNSEDWYSECLLYLKHLGGE